MDRLHTGVAALAAGDCGAGDRAAAWEEGDGGDACTAAEPVSLHTQDRPDLLFVFCLL